jgi:hypothetical protein
MVPATLRVAATAFLRLENVEEGIRTGRMEGRLVNAPEWYLAYQQGRH